MIEPNAPTIPLIGPEHVIKCRERAGVIVRAARDSTTLRGTEVNAAIRAQTASDWFLYCLFEAELPNCGDETPIIQRAVYYQGCAAGRLNLTPLP